MTAINIALHASRRRIFLDQMAGGAALIPTAVPRMRSRDTDYRFRPDSDFYYLTGFKEPGAALLLLPEGGPGPLASHHVVAFVQPKDPHAEVWHGRRLGADAAPAILGVDAAYPIDQLEEVLARYLTGVPQLYYGLGTYPEHDAMVLRLLPQLGNRHVQPPGSFIAPATILHEMRLRKDPTEARAMRRAAAITAEGYREAIAAIRPGGMEYEVEAALTHAYRRLGGDGHAYNPIVAGGDNATILHYNENDMPLCDGDLILIDSGAEYDYYACDITRTYPINGRFSPAQRAIYELVLEAQRESLTLMKVGHHVKSYHERAIEVLTAGLVRLGLLKGEPAELIAKESFKQFYMHGTGHYLGLDTHDVGRYKNAATKDNRSDGQWRALEPGMVLTCEPGLYIAKGTPGIDPAFYGIGVRIEDDVLITETGQEILTAEVAKDVAAIEAQFSAVAHGQLTGNRT